MTSRERVLCALNHQQPDRIPVYFGGVSTFVTDEVYEKLREYFGLEGYGHQYRKGHTRTYYDDRLLEALGSDIRCVVFELPNHGIKEVISDTELIDEWGVPHVKVGGMWSRINPPLAGADLETIKNHPFPEPKLTEAHKGLRERAKMLRETTDYAIVAPSIHAASFLEEGCWIRGSEEFFCDLYLEEEEAHVLLDKIMDTQIKYYELFLKEVGEYVDIVETAEDYGTQQSMFISPETYRSMIMPRRKKIYDVIHKYAPQAKIFHHSCGAVRKLIPDLIETGVDILNPIQPNLPGMDPEELKAEFGDKLCFCGGMDMQHALNGTFEDIDANVLRYKNALGKNGGYFYGTSNHIQRDMPIENIIHLFEAFKTL